MDSDLPRVKGKINAGRLRQMNEKNYQDHSSQPSISPSRVDQLLDDKRSIGKSSRVRSIAHTSGTQRTRSILNGISRIKQDNLFAEPSLLEKKILKQNQTITPTGDRKIDIFNADMNTRNMV